MIKGLKKRKTKVFGKENFFFFEVFLYSSGRKKKILLQEQVIKENPNTKVQGKVLNSLPSFQGKNTLSIGYMLNCGFFCYEYMIRR